MVVIKRKRSVILTFLITVSIWTLAASDLTPRFAVALWDPEADAATRLVVESLQAALTQEVPAIYFAVSEGADTRSDTTDLAEIISTAWDRYQAEIVIVLTARSPSSDKRHITASFFYGYPPPGSPAPVEAREPAEVTVTIDNAGRYQRPDNYTPIINAVAELVPVAGPGREVRIRSNGPFRVEGLPEYVTQTQTTDDELKVVVRGLRTYRFTLHRPGYRSETRTVYVERNPVTVTVPLRPYPRHSVTAYLRNLAFPGLEYAYYPESTRWVAGLGVTSFLLGVTPLREISHPEEGPQLFTSYGLTELEATWQVLLRSRDRIHRFGLGAGGAARFVHGNVAFGVDPVVPAALRLIGSWEWELPGRLTLTQRLAMDMFIVPRPEFFSGFSSAQRISPPDSDVALYRQAPTYRLGLRVRL